jgi:hypothetical protein
MWRMESNCSIMKNKDCHLADPIVLRRLRAGDSLDLPADVKESRKNATGFGRRPAAHAVVKETFRNWSGRISPCSSRSASTRSVSA